MQIYMNVCLCIFLCVRIQRLDVCDGGAVGAKQHILAYVAPLDRITPYSKYIDLSINEAHIQSIQTYYIYSIRFKYIHANTQAETLFARRVVILIK